MKTDMLNAAIPSDWLAWLLEFFGLSELSGLEDLAARLWSQGSAIISILVLATLIYKGYKALEAAGSLELLRGVFSIGLLYLVSHLLNLEFLVWLLDRIIPTLLILMAIILQPELRRIFVQIGRQIRMTHRQDSGTRIIENTLGACEQLSDMGRGALIVFRRENSLRHILRTGTMLNSTFSAELLISIFGYDTPLHDGATVLADSKVIAGGCILPIDPEDLPGAIEMPVQNPNVAGIGTRHYAALKLARETDAVILVVSEETSNISLVYDGQMRSKMTGPEIAQKLRELLIDEAVVRHHFLDWLRKVLLGRPLLNTKASPKAAPPQATRKSILDKDLNETTNKAPQELASSATTQTTPTQTEKRSITNPKVQDSQELTLPIAKKLEESK